MRKLVMMFIVLMLASTAVYAAPDRTGKIDAGITVSGAIPTDNSIDSTVYVGGNLAYGVCQWFAVGFSGGWQDHGSKDLDLGGGTTFLGPDFNAVPLFGDLIVRVPVEQQSFIPYGVVGLGSVIWNVADTRDTAGNTYKTKVNDAFALKLGGGLDWFLNKNWILNFESAYVFNRPDVTLTASNGSTSASATVNQVKLDYWFVGGGVKYLFD